MQVSFNSIAISSTNMDIVESSLKEGRHSRDTHYDYYCYPLVEQKIDI